MPSLIIVLPQDLPAAGAQFDHVLTADGRTVASQSRSPLALLPPSVPGGEVVALVPAQALSWHKVKLPRGSSAQGSPRLRSILEGLLEEHLLDDPAQLHFALAPGARDDTPVWVAVCDRAWLRSARNMLEQAGRPFARIVPEFAPPAAQDAEGPPPDALCVVGTPEDAHLVFVRNGAPVVLPWSQAAVVLADWPETSDILAEPAVAALAENGFKRRVGLQQSGQRWLASSRAGQESGWDWNLAQFDMANSGRARSWKRVTDFFAGLLQSPRWRAARWAFGALLVVNIAGLNAWAWAERASLNAKQQAVRDVLAGTFPQVKVVVDAPVQMARELALLRQAAGGSSSADLDSLMASFGAIAPDGIAPAAINFAASEVLLKIPGLGDAQLLQIQEGLKKQGLAVRTDGDSLLIKAGAKP